MFDWINWFEVAFASPQEQARLFTVAISTVLAITILVLNQWFINRRTRKERMIEKLEELTTAIHGLVSSGHAANHSLFIDKIDDRSSIDQLREFNLQIDKICSLYFQSAKICTKTSYEILNDILLVQYKFNKEIEIDNKNDPGKSFLTLNQKINKWFKESDDTIKLLTKKIIN